MDKLLKVEAQMLQGDEIVKSKEEASRTFRDNLYGGINLSVKTMDRIIIGLFVVLGIAIIWGILV